MKAMKRSEARWLALLLLLCSGLKTEAQPVIYQATGTRDQIQPVIDQFKHDIIYGINGDAQQPPSILGSFKVATFDDVNAGNATTSVSVGFGSSDGIQLPVLPGSRFLVSAGTTDTSNPNRLFGDVHPNYATEFGALSLPSILAVQSPVDSPSSQFIYAGPYEPSVNAFGAVFVDVDSPASTYLTVNGTRVDVPAAPGHANFSFVGLIAQNQASFSYGSLGIYLPGLLSAGEDPSNDMVAIDDIIYGVPEPRPVVLLMIGALLSWATFRYRRAKGLNRATNRIFALPRLRSWGRPRMRFCGTNLCPVRSCVWP